MTSILPRMKYYNIVEGHHLVEFSYSMFIVNIDILIPLRRVPAQRGLDFATMLQDPVEVCSKVLSIGGIF